MFERKWNYAKFPLQWWFIYQEIHFFDIDSPLALASQAPQERNGAHN